jgi:hypothetical protein
MEATWTGMNILTVRLDLQATFSIKEQAAVVLQGKLAKGMHAQFALCLVGYSVL